MTDEERLFYLRNQYADGLLTEDERRELLDAVPNPNSDEQIQRLVQLKSDSRYLPQQIGPERNLWNEIEERIQDEAEHSRATVRDPGEGRPAWVKLIVSWSVVGALAIVAAFILLRSPDARPGTGWSITRFAGDTYLGNATANVAEELPAGEFIRTGKGASAVLSGRNIGTVTLDENSELAVLRADTSQHRLKLRRGTMHAVVTTPPRFFFVETPSSTAVDLGCAYTLQTDEKGNGILDVTAGYVSLKKRKHIAIVPRGFKCRMYERTGPGTPYSETASNDFVSALYRYDEDRDETAVYTAVEHARAEDALSLWHLLWETSGNAKAYLFESLQWFEPLPEGVDRASVLNNDPKAYLRWGEEFGIEPWMIDTQEIVTPVQIRMYKK
jgi:hypothetical protein